MKKVLAIVFVMLLTLVIVGVVVINRMVVHIQLPHRAMLHVVVPSFYVRAADIDILKNGVKAICGFHSSICGAIPLLCLNTGCRN